MAPLCPLPLPAASVVMDRAPNLGVHFDRPHSLTPLRQPCAQLGSCAVAVRTAEGVVLGVEKRLTSPLLEQTSVEKIHEVDAHVGVAISGLTADARTLVDHARVESQNHRFTYDEPMRVESLTQSVCDLMMSFGEGGEENKAKMSRPFGVSMLIAGVDERGAQLYNADPSGTYVAYDAQASAVPRAAVPARMHARH